MYAFSKRAAFCFLFSFFAGMGWGFQIGAELTDFMIVLNTPEAVEAFASGHQVSLGADVGIAIGPLGRNAGVSGNIHGGELASKSDAPEGAPKAKVGVAPCYAYSHSKGLFVGISLEGAVIKPRKDVNAAFYGQAREVTAREILSGMTLPPAACEGLYEQLAAGMANSTEDAAELAK
jgi:lipid-binding SYLF domain-containing protein